MLKFEFLNWINPFGSTRNPSKMGLFFSNQLPVACAGILVWACICDILESKLMHASVLHASNETKSIHDCSKKLLKKKDCRALDF